MLTKEEARRMLLRDQDHQGWDLHAVRLWLQGLALTSLHPRTNRAHQGA
jgi:hypothetical protein